MQNVRLPANCYGCGVCAVACPASAIRMVPDRKGFLRPVIDAKSCRECSLCLSVCGYNDVSCPKSASATAFYGWNSDFEVRKKSSSGGICHAILMHLLKQGYKACVVRYNDKTHVAEHFIAETDAALAGSLGSKYIQSHTIPAFTELKKSGKYAVVGTPCQIASLRKWIEKSGRTDDFLLIDFFCHGVPAGNLWRSYVQLQESRHGKVFRVSWRNKDFSWRQSWCMKFHSEKDGEVCIPREKDQFYPFFLGNLMLNAPCYEHCPFKLEHSRADIRVGDFWGSNLPEEKERDGVSAVLACTEKGHQMIRALSASCDLFEIGIAEVMRGQMARPAKKPVAAFGAQLLIRSAWALSAWCNVVSFLRQIKRRFVR